MKKLVISLLWLYLFLPASAFAQYPAFPPMVPLTDGATITVPCPSTSSAGSYALTLTGNNHKIVFPTCPYNSNNAFVSFRINSGNNAGSSYTGLTFNPQYYWTGGTPYAICTGAGTPNPACTAAEVPNQIDEFGCWVIGTNTGSTEWDCWVPQYNIVAGTTTVWQTPGGANCNSSVTLSNNNLTASVPNGGTSGAFKLCRATTTHTTGQYYFFMTISAAQTSQWVGGIANASESLTTYPGSDNNGVGYQPASGSGSGFVFSGSSSSGVPTQSAGTTVRLDIDLTNKYLGVNIGGTEYPSGCVATSGSGCFSFSSWTAGPAYPAWAGTGSGGDDTVVLNTTSGAGPGGSFVLWQ